MDSTVKAMAGVKRRSSRQKRIRMRIVCRSNRFLNVGHMLNSKRMEKMVDYPFSKRLRKGTKKMTPLVAAVDNQRAVTTVKAAAPAKMSQKSRSIRFKSKSRTNKGIVREDLLIDDLQRFQFCPKERKCIFVTSDYITITLKFRNFI